MGRIFARRLAANGSQVALLDVNEAALAELAAEHDNFHPHCCDISDEQAIADAAATLSESLGPIDLLVHCAALMPSHQLIHHSHEQMRRLFDINYFGTVYTVQAVLADMLHRNSGRIIVFGSIAGHALVPHMGAYCATKSAVNTYIEVLQNELRESDVNIHLVKPPAVNTPLIKQSLDTDSPGSLLNASESGRLADPEKIIDAIEKGVRRNRAVIYPGEARFLQLWATIAPRLWWRTVLSFEKN